MKHLVKLYPKRWRDRYGDEITALVDRSRSSVAGAIDLIRGAIDAHLRPATASQLVFVPTIGFRPIGTRVLLERAEILEDDTRLTILAAAASPERTEVIVEWDSTRRAAVCAPGPDSERRPVEPPEPQLQAALIAGGTRYEAQKMERKAFTTLGWAVRTMTFPPLRGRTERAELRVNDGQTEWRLPFSLSASRVLATPVAVETEREGVVIRVTAVAWHEDELVVSLEAEATAPRSSVGLIGAPAPFPPLRPRHLKIPEALRKAAYPLVIEDDRGGRIEERRRLMRVEALAPRITTDGMPANRQIIVFGAPGPHARSVTLIVPFVEISERDGTTVVDLRTVPTDAELGPHRFRVAGVGDSQFGPERRRIALEVAPSSGTRHFLHPAWVYGDKSRPNDYSYGSAPDGGDLWMDTIVGDPPLATFCGATLRINGPWRLELALP